MDFLNIERRDTSSIAIHNGVQLDNRFVVPHNVDLIIRYQAHINVEVCNNTRAIKYFCWRLFEFPLHYREPFVQRLLIHLPEEHNIYFSDKQSISGIISYPNIEKTIGRSLFFADFPKKFTWYQKYKKWEYRKNGRSIGRIIYVHPSAGELYYLRLLLNEIKGAKTYEDLRTINGIIYTTYKETCFDLDILGDDSEWLNALTQASHWANGAQLRQLFVTTILFCDVANKKTLFDSTWQLLAEDIQYRLTKNGCFFFVYGHGGTVKTFLWNTIINGIRSEGKIVLAIASSGIASLLLHGGKTTHSRFKIRINIGEYSTCKIPKQTQLDILSETIIDVSTKPFGGKTILLGGGFRQILQVVQNGTKIDIINATITHSLLWKECKVFKLETNMRLHRSNIDEQSRNQMREFTQWILQIGDGAISSIETNEDDNEDEHLIEIPKNLLIENSKDAIQSIIDSVYPDLQKIYSNPEYLRQRAIIIVYNETVDLINGIIRKKFEAPEKKYVSSDYISKSSTSTNAHKSLYSTKFLNALKFTNVPNHELNLKLGSEIILMRNISQGNGLCNGTRLIITQLYPNILEGRIISGSNIGDKVYIPRIIMSIEDTKLPFVIQGQTLDTVGLFLPRPVFTHGQLYIALSRVTSATGLKILILDDTGKNTK
ncbi:DNA helicase protein [Dioscorea alata]|uniref:DNA helicase protein n=1 Tax=Dioscorea alata TaxID=55571 RepID=A0ACB7URE2_DIOAL|nr:DNA helicase protein [Dioscorea alata]